jgi:hypothetical protein
MNRSKKIEDLIDLRGLLNMYTTLMKDSYAVFPVVPLIDTENELCEELDAHLSDYFWSCEGDSWEYTLVADGEFDCMDLDEMVEYYNEHKYGELRD